MSKSLKLTLPGVSYHHYTKKIDYPYWRTLYIKEYKTYKKYFRESTRPLNNTDRVINELKKIFPIETINTKLYRYDGPHGDEWIIVLILDDVQSAMMQVHHGSFF